MDALVEELLGLVKDGTSEHDNTGSSVTDLVVLGRGKLGKEFGGLVMDLFTKSEKSKICSGKNKNFTYLHLFENGSTIVGNDNITIGADKHLVHALGPERGSQELGNGSCGLDVDLKSFTVITQILIENGRHPLFSRMFRQNDRQPPII